MNNNAHQIFSKNLEGTLRDKKLPFTKEVSLAFTNVALGSIENVTNLMDKSNERKHKETLARMENEFKETELFMNLNSVGLNLSKEIITHCLSFYEKALDSCIELENALTDLISNIEEDKEIRIKAIEAQADVQKSKLDSTNDTIKTAAITGVALTAITVAGTLVNKFLNNEKEINSKSVVEKIFGWKL